MLTDEQCEIITDVQKEIRSLRANPDEALEASSFSNLLLDIENSVNSLIKIISELSSLLDQMPLSFLGKNYKITKV